MAELALDVDVPAIAVGLARTLRAAGVDASPVRVHTFVRALDALDVTRRRDVYWAGRQTLCASADDLARYDAVFAAHFADRAGADDDPPTTTRLRPVSASLSEGPDAEPADDPLALPWDAATRREVLRHRDLSELSPADRDLVARLLAGLAFRGDVKRTRRTGPAASGVLDRRRTLRRLLAAGGEPVALARQQRRERPRRVVLLIDVSGSMRLYADTMLRFAHAATHRRRAAGSSVPGVATRRPAVSSGPLAGSRRPGTELFTFGTRLTRLTRAMRHRDADRALREALPEVPDWAGGTRVGAMLKAFLDRWGQRGLARGAVVVVMSDGWEQGDVSLLSEQMTRLRRVAHRVVWANPRAGRPGFAPVAAGMAAALPFVDDFVPGHSLDALERLAHVVAGATARSLPVAVRPVAHA